MGMYMCMHLRVSVYVCVHVSVCECACVHVFVCARGPFLRVFNRTVCIYRTHMRSMFTEAIGILYCTRIITFLACTLFACNFYMGCARLACVLKYLQMICTKWP